MAEGWRAWARALARLRGRAIPLSRRGAPGPRHFFLRGRGCACARQRLARGGRPLPGRGRHQRPGRLGRRAARIDSRKRHPAQNCRRRSAASDAGRSRPRLPRAGPARSMARWARNTVSPVRTGPGSLGARRCLCLRSRAGVYPGVYKWAGTGAVAGRRGAPRCRPRALRTKRGGAPLPDRPPRRRGRCASFRAWSLGGSVLCDHRRGRSPVLRREGWLIRYCRRPDYRDRRPEAAPGSLVPR